MSKVFITDYNFENLEIEKQVLEPLGCEILGQQKYQGEQELINLAADADYVITQFAPVTATVINSMRKCKIIVRYGIGVDNVDLNAAAKRDIPVCNVPDYCIDEVADHTLALILSLTRQILPNINIVRSGIWKLAVPLEAMMALKDMTVGIIGLGRIGREVSNRLKPFKCKILVFDPVVEASAIQKAGFIPATLDELLGKSDLITLHCPSNDKTKYMINSKNISKMKKGVIIVNASRGTLIKTDDLVAGLKNTQIAAAALDVTDPEPINPGNPLLNMENVIITSHIASTSVVAMGKLRKSAANTVACAVRGEKLPNVVNSITR